jgi:hypothetical protein
MHKRTEPEPKLSLGILLILLALIALAWHHVTLPALFRQFSFIIPLLVVATLTRTVTLWLVSLFFFLGLSAVIILALLFSFPFFSGVTDELFIVSVLVPVVEETTKAIPILLAVTLRRNRLRWTTGALDIALLGGAVGCAFGLVEDLIRQWSWIDIIALRDAIRIGPLFLPTAVLEFGSLLEQLGGVVASAAQDRATFIGHGPATAFIALNIGLIRLVPSRRTKILWLLPLLVWGWMVFDHGAYNYAVSVRSTVRYSISVGETEEVTVELDDLSGLHPLFAKLYEWEDYGRLAGYLFLLELPLAFLIERRILGRYSEILESKEKREGLSRWFRGISPLRHITRELAYGSYRCQFLNELDRQIVNSYLLQLRTISLSRFSALYDTVIAIALLAVTGLSLPHLHAAQKAANEIDLPPSLPTILDIRPLPPVQPVIPTIRSLPPVQPIIPTIRPLPPVQPVIPTIRSLPPIQPVIPTIRPPPPVEPVIPTIRPP